VETPSAAGILQLSDAMPKPLSCYTCIPNVPVFLPVPFNRFSVGSESRGLWFTQLLSDVSTVTCFLPIACIVW